MSSEKWVVELEPGVWLASIWGDPGRTIVFDNAKVFPTRQEAASALRRVRKLCSFKSAEIQQKL